MRAWRDAVVRCCIGFGVAMGAPCPPEVVEMLDPPRRPDWDSGLRELAAGIPAADRAELVSRVRRARP